jgi:adenylate cyclase
MKTTPSRRRVGTVMFLVTAIALTGFTIVAYETELFRSAELSTVDTRFRVRGDQDPPKDIVVVAIDSKTFQDLEERWPFPRRIHARAIDRLREAGARVIAYDIQFTEPTDPDNDNALIESIDRAENVVLATEEVGRNGSTNVLGGDDLLQEIGAVAGNVQFPNDPGGTLRRMYGSLGGLRSFGVRAADLFRGSEIDAPPDGDTEWVDYVGPPGRVKTVSFSDLVNGKVPPSTLRGKVAVVGPSAPSLQDLHPTSASTDDLMPGAEIQANAAHTALEEFQLGEVPGAFNVFLILTLGLVGPATAFRFGPLRSLVAGIATALLFTIAVQLAFNAGHIVAYLYPMLALALGMVGGLAVSLVIGAFERERVRDMFTRFVPPEVVDQALAKADDDLRLGGERRIVTVLFSDIRGFTTFSETRPPDEVIDVLNRYLTRMSDVIIDHGGTLISYMGDGIMATFGAPIEQTDHADRAVAAAREMVGGALESFNEEVRSEGLADGFKMGVGLNSGPVMAGNVGSERRLDYTTIGDTTNTAARLEGMTKGSGYSIFIADGTRTMLTRRVDDLVHVDDFEVRGRQAKITVWSVEEAKVET